MNGAGHGDHLEERQISTSTSKMEHFLSIDHDSFHFSPLFFPIPTSLIILSSLFKNDYYSRLTIGDF